MVLCIVVPFLLHDATGGLNNDRNPWWAVAIIVVSGGAYASVMASSRRRLFGMVLWLFTYVFLGLAPYVQARLDVTMSTTPHLDKSLYPTAGWLVLACCVAVVAGTLLARLSRRPVRGLTSSTVDRRRANILAVAGIALFLYYGSAVGFGSFLLSRTELSVLRQAAWPNSATANLLTGGLNMVLLVAFLAQMALRQQRKAARLRPKVLPALITGAVLLYAVNPVSSPRYVFGTVILAVLASLGAYSTMTRYRVMCGAAMAGLVLLFPLADTFRHSTSSRVESIGPVNALATGDFDAFPQIVNTLTYLDAHGTAYGGQLLGVLLFWVPRSVWPGKPEDTGTLLAEFMGYDFTNLSAPLWAELAVNFGVVGAVIGMGALGYWFRRVDWSTDMYLRTSPIPPVVVGAITFYLLIVLRGSLLIAASYLLVILLASWFVTRPRPWIVWRKDARRGLDRGGRQRPARHGDPVPGAGGGHEAEVPVDASDCVDVPADRRPVG